MHYTLRYWHLQNIQMTFMYWKWRPAAKQYLTLTLGQSGMEIGQDTFQHLNRNIIYFSTDLLVMRISKTVFTCQRINPVNCINAAYTKRKSHCSLLYSQWEHPKIFARGWARISNHGYISTVCRYDKHISLTWTCLL